MKKLHTYINGNYIVHLFDDGTKVRHTEDDEFDAVFPENIDLKITNWCDIGCAFCHENSNLLGKASDLKNLPNFFKTLRAGTELAIGGGKVTSHPDLVEFLTKLKAQGIIANITIQEKELTDSKPLIEKLIKERLVWGVGISPSSFNKETIDFAINHNNVVLHLINGIHTKSQIDLIKDKGLKILILGYKEFRRGADYIENHSLVINENKKWLSENIVEMFGQFKVVSFDNLSIKQLDIESKLEPKKWAEFYMGDDGQHTMYIDLVEQKFAKNST